MSRVVIAQVQDSVLPAGAATEAKQDSGIVSLQSIDGKATANNSSLASLDTKLGEVQTNPPVNTLLGRLKDIWDRLLTGIVIRDVSGNLATVTASGELRVKPSVDAPAGTTPVNVSVLSSVTGTVDNTYIIPNGETLILLSFQCGSEGSFAGSKARNSKVELYYAPDGTVNVNAQLLALKYLSNSNAEVSFSVQETSFLGDGTAAIILRRVRLDGGVDEMFGRWGGYY